MTLFMRKKDTTEILFKITARKNIVGDEYWMSKKSCLFYSELLYKIGKPILTYGTKQWDKKSLFPQINKKNRKNNMKTIMSRQHINREVQKRKSKHFSYMQPVP